MPLTTLASEFFKKIEQHHWHEVSDFLAADFMYYGPEPEPINQSVWLDLIESSSSPFRIGPFICLVLHLSRTIKSGQGAYYGHTHGHPRPHNAGIQTHPS